MDLNVKQEATEDSFPLPIDVHPPAPGDEDAFALEEPSLPIGFCKKEGGLLTIKVILHGPLGDDGKYKNWRSRVIVNDVVIPLMEWEVEPEKEKNKKEKKKKAKKEKSNKHATKQKQTKKH